MLIFFLQGIINLYYAGHLGDKNILAAIGLSQMLTNCVVETLFFSLNCSQETLVSQAFGAGNIINCGVYLNRGTISIIIAWLLVCIVFLQCESILIFFGQDPIVSSYTQTYINYQLPAILIYGLSDLNRKFLNSFRKNIIPLISFTIAVSIHPFWIDQLKDLGIVGISISSIVTNSFTFILLKIFIGASGDLKEVRTSICDNRTLDLRYYWSLAVPFMIVVLLENWVWE